MAMVTGNGPVETRYQLTEGAFHRKPPTERGAVYANTQPRIYHISIVEPFERLCGTPQINPRTIGHGGCDSPPRRSISSPDTDRTINLGANRVERHLLCFLTQNQPPAGALHTHKKFFRGCPLFLPESVKADWDE